jgi:ABC-type multidrug transport system fused ATPase/permease subunit
MDMTRIVVAHRPQTAGLADRIVVLGNGRVQPPPGAS